MRSGCAAARPGDTRTPAGVRCVRPLLAMDFPLYRWKIDQLRDVAATIGTGACLLHLVGDSREGMLVRHREGRGHACSAIRVVTTQGAAYEIAARRSLRPCSGVEPFRSRTVRPGRPTAARGAFRARKAPRSPGRRR